MRSGGCVLQVLWMVVLAPFLLRAETGDVESSHDYPGFPRVTGFLISDFDEDNPAEFDFPIARPLPDDADHVETVHVKGHRYVIRYELSATGRVPTLYQTQQYYEKLASDGGYTVEKSGAVGNVTETFHKSTATHEIWVFLEPAVTSNVVTVVESANEPKPLPPRLTAEPTSQPLTPNPAAVNNQVPGPEEGKEPSSSSPAPGADEEPLYESLETQGRVVVPFAFRPGKDELDASSQPLVDEVVAMMNKHPELYLRIESHTDSSGDPDDAMRLSSRRAYAVLSALKSAHADVKKLDAVGVGGLQPIASNNTAEGRVANRRIELVLWKKNPGYHPPSTQ